MVKDLLVESRVLRLVRMADSFRRPTHPEYAQGHETAFTDGFPLVLISEESLLDLNARLERRKREPVPMEQFRPNIVVQGCNPFAEDTWQDLQLGGQRMSVVKPCSRCKISTTNQDTGTQAPEPLETLRTYRTGAALQKPKKEWKEEVLATSITLRLP